MTIMIAKTARDLSFIVSWKSIDLLIRSDRKRGRMSIGLIDVDGHNFPNLALMKISAYHKAKGDHVEWCNPLLPYDKVYQAKVFDFTVDFNTCLQAKEIIKGGTGYGLDNKLPDGIENIFPDYSLYPQYKNTAYGFLTRGCPRGCGFCIVGNKEGLQSRKVADLEIFWNGQKEIKLLDPNMYACKDWKELSNQLIRSKAYIDFTQGVDIRVMTDEKIESLNSMKLKMMHFAWDSYEMSTYEKLKEFRSKLNLDRRKLGVYVLTNFDTTKEQDLERIYKLRELDYDPYVMIYDKDKLPRGHELKKIQRWVNSKWIWRSCERFEDYKK